MKNKTWLIILGLVIAIVAVLGLIYPQSKTAVKNVGGVLDVKPVDCVSDLCTQVAAGEFTDSTTTLLSFRNPTGSIATIDYLSLRNTGVATTSYTVMCGTSSVPYLKPTNASALLVNSDTVGTSTSFGTFVAGLDNPYHNTATSSPNGNSRVQIGANDYLNCYASTTAATYVGAFTEVTNTFAGDFVASFRWAKNQ